MTNLKSFLVSASVSRLISSLVAFLWFTGYCTLGFAQCSYPFTSWTIKWVDAGGTIREVALPLPAAKQGTYYAIYPQGGQGPCELCPSSHTNCNGGGYDHVHFPDVMFDFTVTIGMQIYTITSESVAAYWRTVYKPADGYTETGVPNFTQNCYGYAFGTGTFVQDEIYGVGRLALLGQTPCCYLNVGNFTEIEIASRPYHAIKVTGKNCPQQSTTPKPIITTSKEKNRESQIFSRSGDCPNGIDLINGKGNYSHMKKKP